MLTLVVFFAVLTIVLALIFDFVNGFHDTANACATVIYSKALPPQLAIILSGVANFLGAVCLGTAVAVVITKIIPLDHLSLNVVMSVLLGGLTWNLLTWYYGLPVSSSHCLIGSLFGAGVAAAGIGGVNWHELTTVLLALLISPILGFGIGYALTFFARAFVNQPPPLIQDLNQGDLTRFAQRKQKLMCRLQILSSFSVSFAHGSNDGQKTMGIIALVLATQFTHAGYSAAVIPLWVILAAAIAISLGTMIGGWRVIRTIGEKISSGGIDYAHGFGAELGTAVIIYVASMIGAPISTTHTLTSAVTGGALASHGYGKINRATLKTILLAWVMTLPVAAVLAGGFYYLTTVIIWLHHALVIA